MKELVVHIEVNGNYHVAGYINGNTAEDATFSYDRTYLENNSLRPISISLPKEKESFSPKETRNFFDGLLPEGFTRRSVASNIHASEEDYLAVLEHLGRECIGALKITALNESLTRVTKFATLWKLWDDSKTTEVSDVSVIFPLTSINSVQDSECGIKFSVEAIQANAITNDDISTETLPVQPAYHYALAETISSGDKYALTINANSKNYYIPSIPTTGNKAAFVEYTDVADIPVSETFTIRRLTDENTKGVLVNGNGEYLYHSGGTNTSVYIKHEETEKPDSYYAWTLPTVDTPRLVNSSNLTLFLHVTALDMYFVAKDFTNINKFNYKNKMEVNHKRQDNKY